MTTELTAPVPARSGFWATYGALWRAVPGRAAYLLAVFVLAVVSLSVLASVFLTGVGLLLLIVGLPIVVGAMFLARGFGLADRFLLRLTGLAAITEPEWNPDLPGQNGFWRVLTRPLRAVHYWMYLLHGTIVSPILSTISFALTVAWLSVGLGGLTYWFWGAFIPRDEGGEWGQYVAQALPRLFGSWDSWAIEVVLYLIAGVLFTVTMPWVFHALARAHHAVAESLLGRWASDDLAAEMRAEATARAEAVRAEDLSLRRLERDIHDGPQQRLVRLQMDLSALERRAAAGDADAAAELAREAGVHAKAALDELRALSSGVAPPLLQDRGLAAALTAVAEASPLAVTVDIDPDIDAEASSEVARTVYFTVAELLTNAAKHTEASSVEVAATVQVDEGPSRKTLHVVVRDDGRGGAVLRPGHGLEGLRARIAGLRGDFTVESPVGGPTRVVVRIPLT